MYIYSFSVVGDTPGLLYDKVFSCRCSAVYVRKFV
uniref:Uncharacterized protein n=1 Tax=Anguilla anguilla TaxID=7936 RepID=A0A0E9SLL3_ANGAN